MFSLIRYLLLLDVLIVSRKSQSARTCPTILTFSSIPDFSQTSFVVIISDLYGFSIQCSIIVCLQISSISFDLSYLGFGIDKEYVLRKLKALTLRILSIYMKDAIIFEILCCKEPFQKIDIHERVGLKWINIWDIFDELENEEYITKTSNGYIKGQKIKSLNPKNISDNVDLVKDGEYWVGITECSNVRGKDKYRVARDALYKYREMNDQIIWLHHN